MWNADSRFSAERGGIVYPGYHLHSWQRRFWSQARLCCNESRQSFNLCKPRCPHLYKGNNWKYRFIRLLWKTKTTPCTIRGMWWHSSLESVLRGVKKYRRVAYTCLHLASEVFEGEFALIVRLLSFTQKKIISWEFFNNDPALENEPQIKGFFFFFAFGNQNRCEFWYSAHQLGKTSFQYLETYFWWGIKRDFVRNLRMRIKLQFQSPECFISPNLRTHLWTSAGLRTLLSHP